MNLARLLLNDFRAFPGPSSYEIKLDSKNLLLFGENGAGKSSILIALREFFNLSSAASGFATFRNVFTTQGGAPLTTGQVTIEFDDGAGPLTWNIVQDIRQTSVPSVASAALRLGILDYRLMQQTNSAHASNEPNLFEILISNVLKRMPVTSGGRQTTFGALLDRMHGLTPKYRTAPAIQRVNDACTDLSVAIATHLPTVVTEANAILSGLGQPGLAFQLTPDTISYHRETRAFRGKRISFTASLHGHVVTRPQQFLNEARLSALALAIYLAALKVSIPRAPPGVAPPAKIMVLDDVLIGLDMSNRLPLLNALTTRFSDWQIILLTHDQPWYSLARKHLASKTWKFGRLATAFDGTKDVPIYYDDTNMLDRAELHLNIHADERASGVYIRLAFEEMLKDFSARCRLPVAYQPPGVHSDTNAFWTPIKAVKVGRSRLIDAGLERDVEACRRNVANPLCHYGDSNPLRAEVQEAVKVLRRLATTLDTFDSGWTNPLKSPKSFLDAAILECGFPAATFSAKRAAAFLRGAFNEAVAELAARKRLLVEFRTDLVEFATIRLWDALKRAPVDIVRSNPTDVAAIQTHGLFFLAEFDWHQLSRKAQADFSAALAALTPLPVGGRSTCWLDRV